MLVVECDTCKQACICGAVVMLKWMKSRASLDTTAPIVLARRFERDLSAPVRMADVACHKLFENSFCT
jgi:hypothetical protein